ncbi:hypothetical protein [Eubacterium sp.]
MRCKEMKDMISKKLLKEAIAVYMQKKGEIILREMEKKNNGKDKTKVES